MLVSLLYNPIIGAIQSEKELKLELINSQLDKVVNLKQNKDTSLVWLTLSIYTKSLLVNQNTQDILQPNS